jgi:hypothetical protein
MTGILALRLTGIKTDLAVRLLVDWINLSVAGHLNIIALAQVDSSLCIHFSLIKVFQFFQISTI